jgi:glycosyltransferase involved in cell wall biosynthesis
MNVLVFTSLYPNNVCPNHGLFIQQRIRHGVRVNGWNVKIVAPILYYPPGLGGWRAKFRKVVKKTRMDGIEVLHPWQVMIPKVGMLSQGFLLFVSTFFCVKKLQQSFAFDLIDAHYLYPDGFAAILLGKVLHRPVVVSARGSDLNVFKDIPIIRRLIAWTLQKANHVIVVSDALKRSAVALGVPEGTIRVIPNGVDPEKFFPIPTEEARLKLDMDSAPQRVLLSVCHLTKNKGVDILLKAVALLSESTPETSWQLLIVGDGVERNRLEQLAHTLHLGSKVKFLGAVAHDHLNWLYNAADIVCLLSEQEGWPNVVVEALACGRPVLATAVGGIPEILTSTKVGIFVDRDPVQVAKGLQTALGKEWSRSDILEHAKQFRWRRTAEAVQEVFQSVLHQPSSNSESKIVTG